MIFLTDFPIANLIRTNATSSTRALLCRSRFSSHACLRRISSTERRFPRGVLTHDALLELRRWNLLSRCGNSASTPPALNANPLGSKVVVPAAQFNGNPICNDRCDCSRERVGWPRRRISQSSSGWRVPVDLFLGELIDWMGSMWTVGVIWLRCGNMIRGDMLLRWSVDTILDFYQVLSGEFCISVTSSKPPDRDSWNGRGNLWEVN